MLSQPGHAGTVDTIQTQILKRICFLELQPGDQLKEAELAAEFGVSRTPVRDAISRISHLGLVETRNGVGTVIIALSPSDVRHVYEMRMELAVMIGAQSPCPVSAEDQSAGRALLEAATELEQAFDTRRYIEINHQLHSLIASLIGNRVLRSFWWQTYYQAASTWYRLSSMLGSKMAAALVEELRDICTALEHGDTEAIGFIQRTHIGYGYKRIQSQLLAPQETS